MRRDGERTIDDSFQSPHPSLPSSSEFCISFWSCRQPENSLAAAESPELAALVLLLRAEHFHGSRRAKGSSFPFNFDSELRTYLEHDTCSVGQPWSPKLERAGSILLPELESQEGADPETLFKDPKFFSSISSSKGRV